MKFELKELSGEEAAGPLWDRIRRAAVENYPEDEVEEAAARAFVRESLAGKGSICLAGYDTGERKLAGVLFAGPYRHSFLAHRDAVIYWLYVWPEYRNLGLASQLLDRAESALAARGVGWLRAHAAHNDDRIISMGERRGYVREIEVMVKEL